MATYDHIDPQPVEPGESNARAVRAEEEVPEAEDTRRREESKRKPATPPTPPPEHR